jgi:uncharacterized protein YbaA (DUF1428 family)
MAEYVDGFVLNVPKKSITTYKKIAEKAGKIWMEHGALSYYECVGDDLKVKMGISFPKLAKSKPTDKVVFSFITYKSKKHRDSVNKKVMKDPRMNAIMPENIPMPFDCNKITYGGFKTIVKK